MTRVGVLGDAFITWGGGIDFLRTITDSLRHAPEALDIHVLLPIHGPRLAIRSAVRSLIRRSKGAARVGNAITRDHVEEFIQDIQNYATVHRIDHGATAVSAIGRKLQLQGLVPAVHPLPTAFPIPWVGYLNDFQHRYYPCHFTPAECAQRDQVVSTMLHSARSVIVNGRTVAKDATHFFPDPRAKVFALPFSAAPQPKWLAATDHQLHPASVPENYLIACNQFWKHKDHSTLFTAFARIAREFPTTDLICTGVTSDYRDLSHFPSLMQQLERDGIQGRVHILGMIPKLQQITLLKNSIALIQPTLFEGTPGGLAVFDALALGVRCVVSDIAVNQELDEPLVTFFCANDADSLTHALQTTLTTRAPTKPGAHTLLEIGSQRRRACGAVLLEALHAAR